jgi:NAD(P)-dependent dehydrogenase (short-subunit alcohol dehydrogenase family)
VADVTDEAQVAALFDAPFDVVVANAGGGARAAARSTLEHWNADAGGQPDRHLPDLPRGAARDGRGRTADRHGLDRQPEGRADVAAYAAAKHGVLGLVRSVALEVAKRGITCNAICPGFVDTPGSEARRCGSADAVRLAARGRWRGRVGQPDGPLIDARRGDGGGAVPASPGRDGQRPRAVGFGGRGMMRSAQGPAVETPAAAVAEALRVPGGRGAICATPAARA